MFDIKRVIKPLDMIKMKRKLLLPIVVILLLATQACKKKKDEPAGPTVTQISSANLTNGTLNDLTDGMAYQVQDAINNVDKIDMTYAKSLIFTSGNTRDTAYKVLVSPNILTLNNTTPFSNTTTFAPINTSDKLSDITDANKLKTMYDQAVTQFNNTEAPALSNIAAGSIIMFKIRNNTTTPKYGGMVVNAVSPDSLSANISITVQK